MEQELMRIGVSLPDNLLGRFDQIIEKQEKKLCEYALKKCAPMLCAVKVAPQIIALTVSISEPFILFFIPINSFTSNYY